MTTTATTENMKSITIADLERAMREIDLLPKNTDWMLASPDGRAWKGKPEDLLRVLAQHHPLLTEPFKFGGLGC